MYITEHGIHIHIYIYIIFTDNNSEDEDPPPDAYAEVLDDLTKKWILLEGKHRTSKSASDDFWLLAKEAFPKLHRAKISGRVSKNIPKFTSLRRKMYKSKVPKITLKIGYQNRETKEITVIEGEKTPSSRFNPQEYEKLYEVATVEVIFFFNLKKSKKKLVF